MISDTPPLTVSTVSPGGSSGKPSPVTLSFKSIVPYDAIINQLPTGFHLEHSRSASRNPYDEENEEFIVRSENTDVEIRIYCPVAIQKFTVAGYNVVKDCWIKFHSYRYTHREFSRDDLRELLDLFNKIASQMQYVTQIDEILHGIVSGEVPLLDYEG